MSADQNSTAYPLVILSGAKDLLSSGTSDLQVPRRFSVGSHNPLRKRKGASAPKLLAYLTLTALVLFIFATQALAQGCAQCLDSTRATPPAVQAAYRHAILLLGGFGASLFLGGALLLRKIR